MKGCRRVRLVLAMLPLLLHEGLSAQTPEQQNAPLGFLSRSLVIPPSPEASNLGQYGNVPVSLYTGKVDLQIPLYELKGREISLPISLSYNSGGIKVGEAPSWAGLGWTLSAGGVVTKSVMGRPDLCETYYSKGDIIYQNVALLNEIEKQDFYLEIAKGYIETEPDAYFYNVAGLSGRFFVKTDRTIVQMDYKPIRISMTNPCSGTPTFFSVTGPDGKVYNFSDLETTTLTYDDAGLISALDTYTYTSSWYLTTMISANYLDTIYFDYHHDPSVPLITNELSAESMSATIHGPTSSDGSGETPPCGTISGPRVGASASTNISRLYLKQIRLGNKQVDLASANGSSWSGGRTLNSITVTDEGIQEKRIEFEHTYFDDPSEPGDERLRLDKLYMYGPSALLSPPYEFTYSPMLLPPYYSRAIDHWGYCNGSDQSSLLPNIQYGTCTIGGGADREPDAEAMKACSLIGVKYPTGGRTEFEFEPHTRGKKPYLANETVEEDHPYSNSLAGGTMPVEHACAGSTSYKITTVTIPESSTRETIQAPQLTWNELEHGEGARVFAGLIKSSNFSYTGCDFLAFATQNPSLFEFTWYLETGASQIPSNLDPGEYKLIVVNEFSFETVTLGLTYYTESIQEVLHTFPNTLVGGMRIKRIRDYSDNDLIATTREFTYDSTTWLNGNPYSYSTGITFGDPQYSYTSSYFSEAPCSQMQGPIMIDYNSTTLHLQASSRTSLGTVMGSHVGYSSVVEKQSDPSTGLPNGWKVYAYRNNFISPVGFPFSHEIDTYGQGDLLTEEVHDANGNLLLRKQHTYSFDVGEARNSPIVHGVKVYGATDQSNQLLLAESAPTPGPYDWYYEFNLSCSSPELTSNRKTFKLKNNVTNYRMEGHWQYLSRTTTTEFNNGEALVSYEERAFANAGHANVTSIERSDSKGQVRKTVLKYASDAISTATPDADAALSTLAARNVVTLVIQKTEEKPATATDPALVYSSQRVDYGLIGGNPFPRDIYFTAQTEPFPATSLSNEKYELRATYHYNSEGELTKYHKEDDLVESFLWSSDHEELIAEVKGAEPAEASFTSFENSDNEGNWVFSNTPGIVGKAGDHGLNLDNNPVSRSGLSPSTKYVVSFWARNGTPAVSNVESGNDDPLAAADGWRFFRKVVSGTTTVSISGTVGTHIDELRLHPALASMTTYTYRPAVGLVCVTDVNGNMQSYDYEETGRLRTVRDSRGSTVKTFTYHYRE